MRKLVLAAVTLFAMVGCAERTSPARSGSTPPPPGPALGADFTVAKEKSVTLSTGDVEVAYNALVEDSRCAPGTTCVWEGDATVRITLNVGGGPEALQLHTNPQFATTANSGGTRSNW
ncbi:MAG: hypothetical protein M3443_01690 [Actinomycetota bacterium]|nr:hypothetical protein [Actinomycetota bacterium]